VVGKGWNVCGQGKVDWVLMVVLAGCLPRRGVNGKCWGVVASGAGCGCIVHGVLCGCLGGGGSGCMVTGMGRGQTLLYDLGTLDDIWYPEGVVSGCVVKYHLLCQGEVDWVWSSDSDCSCC